MEEYLKNKYGNYSKLNIFFDPINKEYYKYPDEDNYDNIFYINDDDYMSWKIYPALDITKEYNRDRYIKMLGGKSIEFFKFEIEDYSNILENELEIIPAKLEYGKIIPGVIKQKTKEKNDDFILEKGEINMIETLNHINKLIETNKTNFKDSNYLAILNDINKLENLEIKERLASKINSIYYNRINGKGKLNDGELKQVITEFEQMQNMIKNYTEQIKANNETIKIEENIPTEEAINNLENIDERVENMETNEGLEEQIKDDFSSIEEYLDRDNIKRREHSRELRDKLNERYSAKNTKLGEDLQICKEFLKQQINRDGKQYYTDEYLETMTDDEIIELANDIFENTSAQVNYYNKNLLYGIVDSNGVRKFTDEDIQSMDADKVNEIVSNELDGLSSDEITRIQNRARFEEKRREQINNTSEPTNLEELIDKYKQQLNKETPIEEAKVIVDRINESIIELYKQEQEKFESDLKNANTVDGKLETIEKREERLKEYQNYYNFEQELNSETINYIEEKKNELNNTINNEYNNKKQNGEYCWKEFVKVNESKKYVENNIKDDNKKKFDELIENMFKVVETPNQEEYDKWKNDMNEFVKNSNLEGEKLTPYLTAKLEVKYPDRNLKVDKNFDIDGLGLTKTSVPNPTPTPETPRKGGKVIKVIKDLGNWFLKHKKKLILIGLGLALTTFLVYQIPTVQMMINSALWNIGKAKGTLTVVELANLHSANEALSKIAAGGQFVFEKVSGLYTLGGAAGAEALYSAGQAGLVNSLMKIAQVTSVGLVGSGVISAVIDKIKKGKTKEMPKPDEPEKEEVIYGPLEPELAELFNDCETVILLDSTDGPGRLIAPKDATEEQIEKAKTSGKLGVGTYVVVTPTSKKIIDKYNKEKEKNKDNENKESEQPETPKKDESKELLETIKAELAKIREQNKELEERIKEKDSQIQKLTEKLAELTQEKTAPTLG